MVPLNLFYRGQYKDRSQKAQMNLLTSQMPLNIAARLSEFGCSMWQRIIALAQPNSHETSRAAILRGVFWRTSQPSSDDNFQLSPL
jgi:hypothetical protein